MSSDFFSPQSDHPGPQRRILFLTGTRADFGKMKPLMRAVQNAPEFVCEAFVTGMHMLKRYGLTVNEIRNAGITNIFTFINQDSTERGMDVVLANTIRGLGHYVREFRPDMIVVHGDRVEALGGAIVGSLHNILVAHVEGGEISGTIDELLRHAISKLSHLHFVSNEQARRRLIQMGELESSVHIIGSPNIDIMLSDTLPTLAEVKQRYDIPHDEYALLIYHPVTTELEGIRAHAQAIVTGAIRSGLNYVVIYPNNDSGTESIMEVLESVRGHPRFTLLPSMRFEYYLTLLRHAKAIVGNSSSGVHEAPVYGVPTVNVGTRQLNRFHYQTIIDVSEDAEQIVAALCNLPKGAPSLHFGSGQSAQLFMERLGDLETWSTPCQKQFRDVALGAAFGALTQVTGNGNGVSVPESSGLPERGRLQAV
jgi:UDP-N-acetylglucosamine 2-epimerase (hydrolysing)